MSAAIPASSVQFLARVGQDGPAWSAVGDNYRILAGSEDTGGAFCLLESIVSAGGGPPLHLHEREDEAFFMLEGELTFVTDGQTVKAGPGSYVQLPKGRPHCFKNNTNQPARVLILCQPAGFDQFMREFGHPVPSLNSAPVPTTPADIEKLLKLVPKYGMRILG